MNYTVEEQKRVDNFLKRAITAMMDEGYEVTPASRERAYTIIERMYVGNKNLFEADKFLARYKRDFPEELKRAVFVLKPTPEKLREIQEKQLLEQEEAKKAHRLMMAERRKRAKAKEEARIAAMTPKGRILYRLEQQELKEKREAEKEAKKAEKNNL